jgi:putative thioredoxin
MVFDVTEADFESRVLARSHEVPVVVDFWAAWCGPCRTLSPALEAAATAREGQVDLAKVDVDSNQSLAAAFRVQGIPSVKAFRDGRLADEFTGALPPPEVERFFDRLVPSEADALAESDDEAALRRALELDPRHVGAARRLGRLLLARGEATEAGRVLDGFEHDYVAAGLLARIRLSDGEPPPAGAVPAAGGGEANGRLAAAFEAWDGGDPATALEGLQAAVAAAEPAERDLLRQVMVAIFTELGTDHELARMHRRRLAATLS